MSYSHCPTDKAADEMQPKVVSTDLNVEEIRHSSVELETEELVREWRPIFNYQSRTLRESDSFYRSPSVVAAIMYGMIKAEDVA